MTVLQKVSAPNALVPLLLCPNGCAPKSQCPKCLGAPITVPQSTVLLRLCSKRSAPRSGFLEWDLTLLGFTGIEDKLQEGVPDSIENLHRSGHQRIVN